MRENLMAPHSRFRIYTSWHSYLGFISNWFFGLFRTDDSVAAFEREFSRRFEVADAVCVPMARVGIYHVMRETIKPGQEVILSPYTIVDVVNMVLAAGGVPVFADVERDTTNMDPKELERLLSPKTGAVLVTHLHGIPAPIDRIKELCEVANVPLIEDTAQAMGARFQGKRLGTFGKAGVFSVGMYKNINAWFGGVVVSDDRELIARIRTQLRDSKSMSFGFVFRRMAKGWITDLSTHPLPFKALTFWIFRIGFLRDIGWINRFVKTELDTRKRASLLPEHRAQFSPAQAKLALTQLESFDENNEIRRRKASLYLEGLRSCKGLLLPRESLFQSSIFTYYPIQFKKREELLKWMMRYSCDVGAQHLKNCADLPAFAEYYRDCPNARATADEVILLPNYPRYPDADIRRNVTVLKLYFGAA